VPGRSNEQCFYRSILEWNGEISRISTAVPDALLREEWNKLHDKREPTVLSDEYKAVATAMLV
jgi:hypothetical protein